VDDIQEKAVYALGYSGIIDMRKVTAGGFFLLVSSLLYRRRYRGVQERVHQASRLNSLGGLSCDIAHGLSNSLAVVKGYAYRLKKISAADSAEWCIAEKMESASDRMAKIICGVAGYSRFRSADDPEYVAPSSILEYVADFMDEILKSRGIEVCVYNFLGDDFKAWVNRSKLEGMFQSLISNAADSIDGSGKIQISAKKVGTKYYRFDFENDRKGVGEVTLSRILEPFYTTKSSGEWAGLGIGVVKEALLAHKGQVSLKSRPRGGARRSIVMPVDRGE
jgi:signal transduction histidine kinase